MVRPRWTLLVAILGSTMAFVDGTVVNVALPVMQRSLGGTVGQMQWIVEAYAVLLAALVLVGGALGDRLGRRRIFVAGVILFAVASMACGLAPTAPWLIAARAIQGIGAALLVPGSLSLISAAFSEKERGAAIGTWSSATSVMSAIGPVLGGWLVAHASWRWLFFINAPLGAITVYFALTKVTETRDEQSARHIDVLGAVLAILGLGLIVIALLERAYVAPLIAAGLALLGLFVVVEMRSRTPMVPLSLFRSRTFSGANALTLLLYAALGGAMFFLPFNLIQVQRFTPTAAGASLLPLVILISTMSPFMGKLSARWGARRLLTIGPLVAALGFALLARPSLAAEYWADFFPGIIALGLGMGITVAPLTTAVMGSVSEHHTGAASGVNNALARAASVLAIAALGAILIARFDAELTRATFTPEVRAVIDAQHERLTAMDLSPLAADARATVQRALDEAFLAGFRVVMLTCAALAAASAACAFALIERSNVSAPR